MSKNVLYQAKRFDVIDLSGKEVISTKKVTIGVLPYSLSDNMLKDVGVLHEFNRLRSGDYCDTIITGTVDPDDTDLLSCAMRELTEEGGYVQDDVDLWVFLGTFKLSKASNEEISVFGVNVTSLEQGEAKGDGSKSEKLSSLRMTGINDAILTDESLFLSSFLRLFDFFYQRSNDKK